MSELTALGISQNRPFKPKIYQGKRRGQVRNYYDQDRYQNRYRSNSEDRRMSYRGRAQCGQTIEEGCTMIKTIEVTLGDEILEEHKIIKLRILEVDMEVTLEMITLEEVEVGLEKDSTQVTSEEIREVVVDQDQVQEQVLTEIRLDALSVGSAIILLKIV